MFSGLLTETVVQDVIHHPGTAGLITLLTLENNL